MDGFETRLQFNGQLQRLTASQQSQRKLASFALRHRSLDEDLFSCIVEEIERADGHARVNVLFFLQTLCEASAAAGFTGYIDMATRDMLRIARAVASPQSSAGLANLAPTRKVLGELRQRSFLPQRVYEEAMQEVDGISGSSGSSTGGGGKKEKEQVLRRMEQDRERHKRLRENIWVVGEGEGEGEGGEFAAMWDTVSDLNADDLEEM